MLFQACQFANFQFTGIPCGKPHSLAFTTTSLDVRKLEGRHMGAVSNEGFEAPCNVHPRDGSQSFCKAATILFVVPPRTGRCKMKNITVRHCPQCVYCLSPDIIACNQISEAFTLHNYLHRLKLTRPANRRPCSHCSVTSANAHTLMTH